MSGKVITVKFYDRQGAEDLFKCTYMNKVYVRMPSNTKDKVFWTTSSKWSGGYEADCPIRAGITMRVVDKAGNVLFEETLVKDEWNGGTSANKKGDFSYEAINKISEKLSEGLSSFKEWKEKLLEEKKKAGNLDYYDNWLYFYYNCLKETVIGEEYYLGRKAYLVKRECKHTKCDAEWIEFAVLSEDKLDYLAISGYIMK